MRDVLDLHTHTIASGHAYNTINEMVDAAEKKGLKILGITEHGPSLPGSCSAMYFSNLRVMPREKKGIRVLYGVELNILDYEGNVDMEEDLMKEMDIVIASLHIPCLRSGTREENTGTYQKVMENPLVHIIGHPDDGRYPIDYEALVKGAKKHGKLLEINNSSLSPNSYRINARENYRKMTELCKIHQVPVVISSDAHVDLDIGNHRQALEYLEELGFPEDLVANARPDILRDYLNIF